MDSYTFSLAEIGNLDEILSLYKSLINTPGCLWTEDYPHRDNALEDIERRSLYTLKDQSGRIISVATAGGTPELNELEWNINKPCELARIGVLMPMQGMGIASAMIHEIILAVKARGFDGINLIAGKTNPAALALYEKNGFLRCGEASMFGHDYYCYQLKFLITEV